MKCKSNKKECIHTLARKGVDDLLLDTLLALGEALVLKDTVSYEGRNRRAGVQTLPTAILMN